MGPRGQPAGITRLGISGEPMADVRPPPPVWALVTLAFAVALAAGVVLYFQLGTIGLLVLAVGTTAVLAALLVALSYRQSAVLAELAALQRRQVDLAEGRTGDATTGGDALTSGTPTGDGGAPAPAPVVTASGLAADGDRLRVDLRNDGGAPAADLRIAVAASVAADPRDGAATPLSRASAAGDGPGDTGPETLAPGERGTFTAVPTVRVTDDDGAWTAPFGDAVARLRERATGDVSVSVAVEHAGTAGGTVRKPLAAGAVDPADDPTLADVCEG